MGDCGLLSKSHPLPAPTSCHILPDSGQPARVWRAGVTQVGVGGRIAPDALSPWSSARLVQPSLLLCFHVSDGCVDANSNQAKEKEKGILSEPNWGLQPEKQILRSSEN